MDVTHGTDLLPDTRVIKQRSCPADVKRTVLIADGDGRGGTTDPASAC